LKTKTGKNYLDEFLDNFKDYAIFDYNKERESTSLKVEDYISKDMKISRTKISRTLRNRLINLHNKNQNILIFYSNDKITKDILIRTEFKKTFSLAADYFSSVILEIFDSGIYVVKTNTTKPIFFCNEEHAFIDYKYFKFPTNAEDFIGRI